MTKAELQALAVKALGEGATVSTGGPCKFEWASDELFYADARDTENGKMADIWARSKAAATRALAAALTAMTEGKGK